MHFEGTHSVIKVAFQWRCLGIWWSCSSPSGYVLAVCYKVVGLLLTLPEARLWSRRPSCKTWMYFPSSAQQPLSPPTLTLGLLSSVMPWPSPLAHFLLLCNPSWHITSTPSDIKYYLSLDWASQNLPASAGDMRDSGSIPGLGRSPGGGNGNPLQDSCLENPTDRGAWWATVHERAESNTTEAT